MRSSPQRRANWYRELNIQTFNLMLQIESPPSCSFWMSRHVGCQLTKCCVCSLVFSVIKYENNNKTAGCALDYRQAVNSFVRLDDTDLWPNLLSNAEWHAIELVTTWLKSFRSATIPDFRHSNTHALNDTCYILWTSRGASGYSLLSSRFNVTLPHQRTHRCSS